MKICPTCAVENRDEAAVCYFCGHDLRGVSPTTSGKEERTQPVKARTGNTQPRRPGVVNGDTLPGRPASANPDPAATDPHPPAYRDPFGAQPGPDQTAPYAPGYGAPRQPQPGYPAYGQDPRYAQNAQNQYGSPYDGYAQPTPPQAYFPPAPMPPAASPSNRPAHLWRILTLALALILLAACGFAAWTLTSGAGGGIARLSQRFATQASGVIPAPAVDTPVPQEADTPTPWPTFTAEAAQATSTPEGKATGDTFSVEKLLSPACASALDHLNEVSGMLKSQPAIPLDANWRASLSQSIAEMKTACGTLEAASPAPGQVSQAQKNLSQASSEFDQAGKLFDEGVKNLQPAKLLEAAGHVTSAVKLLNQGISELQKIGH